MNFELTDEQKDIRDTIRKFMVRECSREVASQLDGRGEFPGEMLKKIVGMGFCGLNIAEEYGGAGPNTLGALVVVEELSTIYPVLGGAYIAPTFCGGKNISRLGSEYQKNQYLPGLADGSLIFTCGLTEPGGDYKGVVQTETTAVVDGDDFILNGVKSFVRLASRAHYILTLTRTDSGNQRDLSFFIVDIKSPSITITNTEKVGHNGFSLCEVVFSNVRVSKENLLGGPAGLNQGWGQYLRILESEHMEIAACGLGIAQGAYDYAVNYARERVQFNRPIVEFEAIQHMLVDMALDIQAARLLTYRAGWLADKGAPCLLEAAMARAHAGKAAQKAAFQCVQILGGYGYTMEYDAQRYLRDSLVLLNGGGTIEILKSSIGELLDLS